MLTHAEGSVLVLPPHFTFPSMLMAVDILSPPMLLVEIDSILLPVIPLSIVEFTLIFEIYISPATIEDILDDFTTGVSSTLTGPIVIPLIYISPAIMDPILSPILIVVTVFTDISPWTSPSI